MSKTGLPTLYLLAAITTLFIILTCLPCRGFAAELFSGYPPSIKKQAIRLVNLAMPGNEVALEREIQALRKEMLEYSIVSINEIPDRIFERARKEEWKENASDVLRQTTRIAPFSAALWMWLIKEDFRMFRIGPLINDIKGFREMLGWYGLALAGCMTWIFLCVVAAVSWFALWISVSLLLRVQPAAKADFTRVFNKFPCPDLCAFAVFLLYMFAPALAGVGLGVAVVFWLLLSVGYLRRWEIMTAVLSIVLLSAAHICGGALHSVVGYAEKTRKEGWSGGEGHLPPQLHRSEKEEAGGARPDGRMENIVLFARARAEMQVGNNSSAELIWTEWIKNAQEPSPGYNNRGIVRYRMGKIYDALSDFEKAMETSRIKGPEFWNSYQIYLATFRLEDAAAIQEFAWQSLRNMWLFDFRPEEMTRGELLPSPLKVNEVWRDMFVPRLEWFVRDDENSVFGFLFRPLPESLVLPLIAFLCIWMLLWRPLSSKNWMSGVCRACGSSSLVMGDVNTTDICNPCRAQVGGGIRAGEEREIRLHNISMHGRYVKACSVFAPGAGAFWAGKTVSLLVYGIILSFFLGILTVSIGAESASSSLISGIMKGIVSGTLIVLAVLWLFGVVWSWKSFNSFRLHYNIGLRR